MPTQKSCQGSADLENKRKLGSGYEEAAASFLQKEGVRILARNFRCRMGEIDLIGRDRDCLVFVEVKYRRGRGSGSALESVNVRKQRTISRVAGYYLLKHQLPADISCRFDVVGIDGNQIRWVKNAFEYRNGKDETWK